MNRKYAQGFTLIEIAIVLVIIGLLLGGILKGQELITSARVRNLISQQDGVKAAFFGFQDRFRALPGDYTAATTNIANVTDDVGLWSGRQHRQRQRQRPRRIAAGLYENVLAWEHLSKAGFITGTYTCAARQRGPDYLAGQSLWRVHAVGVRRHLRSWRERQRRHCGTTSSPEARSRSTSSLKWTARSTTAHPIPAAFSSLVTREMVLRHRPTAAAASRLAPAQRLRLASGTPPTAALTAAGPVSCKGINVYAKLRFAANKPAGRRACLFP